MSKITRRLHTKFQRNFAIARASWKSNALTKHIDHRVVALLSFPALYLFYRMPRLRRLTIRAQGVRRLYRTVRSELDKHSAA